MLHDQEVKSCEIAILRLLAGSFPHFRMKPWIRAADARKDTNFTRNGGKKEKR